MNKKIKIKQGQNLLDSVIEHAGTLEALADVIIANRISPTTTLAVNEEIKIASEIIDTNVIAFYTQKKFSPATGETAEPIPVPPQPPQPTKQVFNYFFVQENQDVLETQVKPSMAGIFTIIDTNLTNLEVEINGTLVSSPITLVPGQNIKQTFDAAASDTEIVWEGFA